MKNSIKFIVLFLISIGLAWCICFFTSKEGKYLHSDNFHEELVLKGLNGATAMCNDETNNLYIAIGNNIFTVDKSGNMKLEVKEENKILDLEYHKGKIYYSMLGKVSSYDLNNRKVSMIEENINNKGINCDDTKILLKDGKLYLSIGSATNSGVVDFEGGVYDIPPVDTVLNGRNYDENKKGAFVPFNTKTYKGEKIKGNVLGNASVVEIDLSNNKKKLYAYGLRNIKGIDYNSQGKIFGVVGGIHESGYRPLSGDSDYLYEIKGEKTWYGWPDYSGGDPVSSPRFREEGKPKVNFVTDKHESYIMPKPIYQNEKVGEMNSLIIDREGKFGNKDSFIFFDNEEKVLVNLLKEGAIKNIAFFEKDAYVDDIKIVNEDLCILDGKEGVLFKLSINKGLGGISVETYMFLIVINSILIVILITKFFLGLKNRI